MQHSSLCLYFSQTHQHSHSSHHLPSFCLSLSLISGKKNRIWLVKEVSKEIWLMPNQSQGHMVLVQRPDTVWLPECSSSILTPLRWYTAVPMVGCTLTAQPCYRDNRDCFWYSIWETLTAVFGQSEAQLFSFLGHGLVDSFNLIHFHINGSWDWSDLIAIRGQSSKLQNLAPLEPYGSIHL